VVSDNCVCGIGRHKPMNTLAKRAVAGMAGLLVPLAVLIFVCAGTIHFWQGWFFLLSFSLSVIAITAYLLKRDPALVERRMRAGPRAESRPRQTIIQAINLAKFVALMIVPGLDHRFGWSQVSTAIVVIANVLVIASLGFILRVLRENTFAASTIIVETLRCPYDCSNPRTRPNFDSFSGECRKSRTAPAVRFPNTLTTAGCLIR
jgi:hypothetical protein